MNTLEDFNTKLKEMYEEGRPLSQIAQEVGMSMGGVRNRLLAMEVVMRERGGPNHTQSLLDQLLENDPERVLGILLSEDLTTPEKAERLNIHPTTVRLYIHTLTQVTGEDKDVV